MNELKTDKTVLRSYMKKQRGAISSAHRLEEEKNLEEKLFAMPELKAAGSVFCYVSVGSELSTERIISRLLNGGKDVYVPFTKAGDMYAVRWSCDMTAGEWGIPVPKKPVYADVSPDFIIAPALACDRFGGRLGYGGGYYDRFLEKNSGFACAVIFSEQLVGSVPRDGNDKIVNAVLTQHEILYI